MTSTRSAGSTGTGTTFVLVPGAGSQAWYWHRLVAELESRGHEAIAVDLPSGDESAGLDAYADTVAKAIDGRTDVVLVAQSIGGLTAPLVSTRTPGRLLVLVNAMVWRLPVATERRRGEALALRWRDVDLDAGRLQGAAQPGRGRGQGRR